MTTLHDMAARYGRLASEHPGESARLWAGLARRLRQRYGGIEPRAYRRLRARLWRTYSDAAQGGRAR